MKKTIYILGLLICMMMNPQVADAQYIHREKTAFVYNNDVHLSDKDLIEIIGMDTFQETVVGARKQYEVGGNLIWGGFLSILVGAAGDITGMSEDSEFGYFVTQMAYTAGGAMVDAGIVLRIIGKKRLNWVEDYANLNYMSKYSLNIGPTPNGVGLSIQF